MSRLHGAGWRGCWRRIATSRSLGKHRPAGKRSRSCARIGLMCLFLDVQMPGLDGFQVLEVLGELDGVAVVFVTAFDEYAVRAFEVQALDYLLKPATEGRLAKVLDRVRDHMARRSPQPASAEPKQRGYWKRILVRGPRVAAVPVTSRRSTGSRPTATMSVVHCGAVGAPGADHHRVLRRGTRSRGFRKDQSVGSRQSKPGPRAAPVDPRRIPHRSARRPGAFLEQALCLLDARPFSPVTLKSAKGAARTPSQSRNRSRRTPFCASSSKAQRVRRAPQVNPGTDRAALRFARVPQKMPKPKPYLSPPFLPALFR